MIQAPYLMAVAPAPLPAPCRSPSTARPSPGARPCASATFPDEGQDSSGAFAKKDGDPGRASLTGGLAKLQGQLAGTLSGGEQQIFRFVREIAAQGVTILLVEQNVYHTLQVADYAYVLETGRLVLEGPAQALRENEHVRRAYLGG